MPHINPKQDGLVLATNLILLLLLTLMATALIKSAMIEQQMNNHQNLLSKATAETQYGLHAAKKRIDKMLLDQVNLLTKYNGYYPFDQRLNISQISSLAASKVFLASSKTRYVIIYLGQSTKKYPSLSLNKYHLFKIISYTKLSKGTEYTEQQLYSIPIINN